MILIYYNHISGVVRDASPLSSTNSVSGPLTRTPKEHGIDALISSVPWAINICLNKEHKVIVNKVVVTYTCIGDS